MTDDFIITTTKISTVPVVEKCWVARIGSVSAGKQPSFSQLGDIVWLPASTIKTFTSTLSIAIKDMPKILTCMVKGFPLLRHSSTAAGEKAATL